MTWTQRILSQSLPNPPPRDPSNPFWWGPASRVSQTGVIVDGDSSLAISAVFASVNVISSAIAGVPLILYRARPDGGKDRAKDRPLYTILHDLPNDAQTAFEFREYMTACALLWGNGYAEILPDQTLGAVGMLDVPFHPRDVTPHIDTKRRRIDYYEVKFELRTRKIPTEQMFHLRGLTKDGLVGISVIQYAREALGLALATEAFGARFFSQDATPKSILTHPGSFKEGSTAPQRIRTEWQMMHSGLANAHSIAVLEEGMTYQQIGMSNEDSQFLQTRQFTVREIARWFQIQPHMIQDLQNATFTNIEQQSQEFVAYTLNRWAQRWEQTIRHKLIFDPNLYAKHLFDALLRGDALSRYQVYAIARMNELMNPNEIRARENMNPRSDGKGDIYEAPVKRTEGIKEDAPPGFTPAGAAFDELDILARSNGHATSRDG